MGSLFCARTLVDACAAKLKIELFLVRCYRPVSFAHAISVGICASLVAGKSNSLVAETGGARRLHLRGPAHLRGAWPLA